MDRDSLLFNKLLQDSSLCSASMFKRLVVEEAVCGRSNDLSTLCECFGRRGGGTGGARVPFNSSVNSRNRSVLVLACLSPDLPSLDPDVVFFTNFCSLSSVLLRFSIINFSVDVFAYSWLFPKQFKLLEELSGDRLLNFSCVEFRLFEIVFVSPPDTSLFLWLLLDELYLSSSPALLVRRLLLLSLLVTYCSLLVGVALRLV